MSWRETRESQRVSIDADGHRRGARVFRVWNYSRTQILSDPTAIINESGNSLPDIDSPWEGMTLDRYDVSPVGSIYDATALYSNDGLFQGNIPPNPLAPNFISWSMTFQNEEVPIPYGRLGRSRLYIPNNVPSQPPIEKVVDGYVFFEQQVSTPTIRFIVRANVQSPAAIAGCVDAITNQTNKLHKFRGKVWLFCGCDFSQTGKDKWELQYSWWYDPGVEKAILVGSPPQSSLDPMYPAQVTEWPAGSGRLWTRPPYHAIVIRPDPSGDPAAYPIFTVTQPYDDSDPTGYITLPGVQIP